jgi:hypothetical protein
LSGVVKWWSGARRRQIEQLHCIASVGGSSSTVYASLPQWQLPLNAMSLSFRD